MSLLESFLKYFYFPIAFIVILESFFKGGFEKFQFKIAMCFQSLGTKSVMRLCILSWLTLEKPSFC